jgi:peptide-methionine (S)-S-oxide reductase
MIVAMSGLAIGCTPVDPMVTQLPRAAQSAIASTAAVEPTAVEGSAQITADLPADVAADVAAGELATATFAGGCFWCMEQPFDQLPGVVSTTSGYTGGQVENPSYAQVSAGETGHVEAMQVRYDPAQVSYETLLETFWHNIDPLDNLGQFCDKGSQYRSVVFYGNAEQQRLAEASKAAVAEKLNQPVATDILPADPFYNAEDYHQDYYKTRPVRYKVYRFGCGRDQRLSELWGAPAHD